MPNSHRRPHLPPAVQAPQLRREAESLERERMALQDVQLPALHVALAKLNDTHVLEVRVHPFHAAACTAPALGCTRGARTC
jgi:hypothetical protein